MRRAINSFNNLGPHLTRRLYSDSPSPVPSSQIKDHPISHTCDPVWQLLLWNSTRLMGFRRFWPRLQAFKLNQQLEAIHSWIQANSSTTFSPRDTHQPSFQLPGIIRLPMASPANQSSLSHSSKAVELTNLSLDTPCGDPLPRPSSSLIFSVIILSSELHLQIDANSISSLVWSHSNVYSSRNDLLCSYFPLILWKHQCRAQLAKQSSNWPLI